MADIDLTSALGAAVDKARAARTPNEVLLPWTVIETYKDGAVFKHHFRTEQEAEKVAAYSRTVQRGRTYEVVPREGTT